MADLICCITVKTSWLQLENMMSVKQSIVSMSAWPPVLCTPLCWWTSSMAPQQDILPPAICIIAVWFDPKWLPPLGFVAPECPRLVPQRRAVVSCVKEGVEGPTAGSLFRQESRSVWSRDACQLCKARLSLTFLSKKRKKRAVIAQCRRRPSAAHHHTLTCFQNVLQTTRAVFSFIRLQDDWWLMLPRMCILNVGLNCTESVYIQYILSGGNSVKVYQTQL